MNLGAGAAKGEVLLFLHADTFLPSGFDREVRRILAYPDTAAGAFKLAINAPGMGFRLIERLANFRSHAFGFPYGDQAIFLKTGMFRKIGQYPDIPMMEDVFLINRLRKMGRIRISGLSARTSARRWEKWGILRTTVFNQMALLAFLLKISPLTINRWYNNKNQ
jgi:hypothetical protein